MPYYYFDSTALVKRYSPELGTQVVNRLVTKRGNCAIVGTTSLAEFCACLARKSKQGELTRDDWYSVLFKFESECERGGFHYVAPSPYTFGLVKRLSLEFPHLKAPQLIHLGLALELRPLRITLVSSDRPLLTACRPLRVNALNPEEASG